MQAGTKSWDAFFYGSSGASDLITVGKPPGSLWVMELSARVFGPDSWPVPVPEALTGVAAVGVGYAAVRRRFCPVAGLLREGGADPCFIAPATVGGASGSSGSTCASRIPSRVAAHYPAAAVGGVTVYDLTGTTG